MRISGAAAMLGVVLTACSAPDGDLAAAAQALAPVYCIFGPRTDNGTFHFQGPNWLLSSSEGLGPQTLDVFVQTTVQPAMSHSDTFKLDPSAVSTAVGYSLTARHDIIGGAATEVPAFSFRRLEAYTSFQRTTWEIRDESCSVVLGVGASFRPIGIYFRTIETSDLRIPDVGVYFTAPVGIAPGATVPVAPAPPSVVSAPPAPRAADAGAADGG